MNAAEKNSLDTPEPLPLICVYSTNPSSWQWFAADTTGKARWQFHTEEPRSFLERLIQRPKLSRIMGAVRCVRSAKRERAVAIAAHSSISTFWTAIAMRLFGQSTPLLSFSFHFPELPTGPRRWIMTKAFAQVRRFTVHSEPERERYANHFGLPLERFDLVRWGVAPPQPADPNEAPIVSGSYICALGKDGRDYPPLIRAMESLPELTLVVVAQPGNLAGVVPPKNVKLFCDIPWNQAMNILRYSQFMALPLETNETSCGHITLVLAMFCRKAIVATDSSGIADYFPANYDSPKVQAKDIDGWAESLRAMASDPARRERCAALAEPFAHACCSHDSVLASTLEVFRKAGIEIPA
jgi:hypothetical protein